MLIRCAFCHEFEGSLDYMAETSPKQNPPPILNSFMLSFRDFDSLEWDS